VPVVCLELFVTELRKDDRLYFSTSAGDDGTRGVMNLVTLIYLVELSTPIEFEDSRYTLRIPDVVEESSSSTALEDTCTEEFGLSL
jgi:hypothetical protein